jgi:hypothetical protein
VEDNAYRRDFYKGTVVCAPAGDYTVEFNEEYTDVSTGKRDKTFLIVQGDGRIFLK